MTSVTNDQGPGRRSNGEGGYQDLGDGRWAYRRLYQGKRVQRNARADTDAKAKRLAKAKVDEAIKKLEAGVGPTAGTITLAAYAHDWLETKRPRRNANGEIYRGVSELTFANYRRDVRRIGDYFGTTIRLSQLTARHVERIADRMADAGVSPENQRTVLVRLGTILSLAEARGEIPRNVADARLVGRPKVPRPRHVQPHEDDLRRLLHAVDDDPLEVLAWLGLGAGLRRQELLGLCWEDIEYVGPEHAVLVVHRRVNYGGKGVGRLEREGLKNGAPDKRVHVGGLVLDVLRRRWVAQLAERRAAQEPGHHKWQGVDYQPDTRAGHIFTNPTNGKPMNPRSADKYFGELRDRAGLDLQRFHALRRVFTTLLRASGTRDRVAMDMTGHRDRSMLEYYDQSMESEKAIAAQALDTRLRELLAVNHAAPISAPILADF